MLDLKSYLDKRVLIQITDQRWFVGTILCVDQHVNLVLGETTEYKEPPPHYLQKLAGKVDFEPVSRFIGVVMVSKIWFI
ncbi:hypothetical protein HDV06_004021 [Boothiomyces sp. JEL0866]|nr:hypothetical protein HDV06_004021 [Boothiomyces sp. JEL0866]